MGHHPRPDLQPVAQEIPGLGPDAQGAKSPVGLVPDARNDLPAPLADPRTGWELSDSVSVDP